MSNHTIAGLVAEIKSLDASDVQELQDCISGIAAHNATVTFVDGNVTLAIDAKLTAADREVLRECADIARSQLRSAEEGGDRETIARWRRRVFAITGLLARAGKEDSR